MSIRNADIFDINHALNILLDDAGKFDVKRTNEWIISFIQSRPQTMENAKHEDHDALGIAFDAFRMMAEEFLNVEDSYTEVDSPQTKIGVWNFLKYVNEHNDSPYITDLFRPTLDWIHELRTNTEINKEENTMEFICTINGNVCDRTEGAIIDDKFYSFEALEESEDFAVCEGCGEWFRKDDMREVDGVFYCNGCFNEMYVECEDCGEYVLREDAHYHGGCFYCESCWEDYFICPHCGDLVRTDYGTWIESENQHVCNHCFRWNYRECACCGEYFREDDMTWVIDEEGDEQLYCEDCLSDHAWSCNSCGRWFSEYVDHTDEGECMSCAGRHFRDTGDIKTWMPPHRRMNYGFKPAPAFCATDEEIAEAGDSWAADIPFYGYELEIDRESKCYREDYWSGKIVDAIPNVYCKQDCSLDWGGDYSGIEIVSHPATLAWTMAHKQEITDCFKMLTDEGWRSHEAGTCGLHVHVSLEAMEKKNPMAVHNMLIIFDKFWWKLVKFSRRTESQLNHWAQRYACARGEYKAIKDMAKGECSRYMAVNLQNTHTVELRMFRGTLKPETFFATLQLVDVIVKKCIELGDDYRKLQMLSWSELVHSDYEELNAYLKERGLSEEDDDKAEVVENPVEPRRPLKVGDYIHCLGETSNNYHEFYGWIRRRISSDNYAVEVDMENSDLPEYFHLHRCNGVVTNSNGRFVRTREMELVTPVEAADAEVDERTVDEAIADAFVDELLF